MKQGKILPKDATVTEREHELGEYLISRKIRVIPQFKVGFYSFDFKVAGYPLLIEVDGRVHNVPTVREKDYIKDRYARKQGYTVIRLTNKEITNPGLAYCANEVQEVIKGMPKSPKERIFYYLSFGDRFRMDLEELPVSAILLLSGIFLACLFIIFLLLF